MCWRTTMHHVALRPDDQRVSQFGKLKLPSLRAKGCSLSSYYWSPPEQKTSCANPWLPSHLEPLHLEIGQQNLPGAQAESSWYPSSCGTPLQERVAEADLIAALEASLFWNHYLGQKNTTSSLKNNKTIWEKFITCARTFTCCERRAWCFTCISKSFIWISHCQQ